jgi:hypothetical protein
LESLHGFDLIPVEKGQPMEDLKQEPRLMWTTLGEEGNEKK